MKEFEWYTGSSAKSGPFFCLYALLNDICFGLYLRPRESNSLSLAHDVHATPYYYFMVGLLFMLLSRSVGVVSSLAGPS